MPIYSHVPYRFKIEWTLLFQFNFKDVFLPKQFNGYLNIPVLKQLNTRFCTRQSLNREYIFMPIIFLAFLNCQGYCSLNQMILLWCHGVNPAVPVFWYTIPICCRFLVATHSVERLSAQMITHLVNKSFCSSTIIR